jgi:hypothetical protein
MFKDNCLVALKRKDRCPCIIDLEILIYLILKSSHDDSRMNSPTLKHIVTQMQQS